jgi:hypothetical protein
MTRQYFYKVDSCKALIAEDQNCICWHDEGTGPLPEHTRSPDNRCGSWREKPGPHPGEERVKRILAKDVPENALESATYKGVPLNAFSKAELAKIIYKLFSRVYPDSGPSLEPQVFANIRNPAIPIKGM